MAGSSGCVHEGGGVDVALETREDGWPLCPKCGLDEVWSPLIVTDEAGYPRTPPLAEYVTHDDFRCYACSWRGSLYDEVRVL